MKCSYSQRVFAAVRNVVNPRHVCRGFESNGQSGVFNGAFPLHGTVQHGSVRYGTAQFGSVCISTAV